MPKSSKRIPLTEDQRRFIFERDVYICCYCGADARSIDHIIPVDKGGTNHALNLVACCRRCNNLASYLLFDSFDDKKNYLLQQREFLDNYAPPPLFEYRKPWHTKIYGAPKRVFLTRRPKTRKSKISK